MGRVSELEQWIEGAFEADRVTVVGTVIAAAETLAPPMVLKNARVAAETCG